MAHHLQRGNPTYTDLCCPSLVLRTSWPSPTTQHRPKRSCPAHRRRLPHLPSRTPPPVDGHHAHRPPYQNAHKECISPPLPPPAELTAHRESSGPMGATPGRFDPPPHRPPSPQIQF